jgi:hypothetical protein
MAEPFLERRREPRVPVSGDLMIGVPVAITVRFVDISAGGVLISSPQKMAVGQRARLHTTLGAEPFSAEVEVRRIADGVQDADRGRFRIGASFTGLDVTAARSVQHFLSGGVE